MCVKSELNPNDPDYLIEEFWIGFKASVINFYKLINNDYTHIMKWSNNLNILKKNKQYIEIENNIRDYMSEYALCLIKFSNSTYHDDILITNMQRWNKLSRQFNFENNDRLINSNLLNVKVEPSKILIIFMVYNELKNLGNKGIDVINSKQVEEVLLLNSFEHIIRFAINNSKTKILVLLKKIPNYDLLLDIRRLYPNVEFTNNIKMEKLCILLKNIS